MAREILNAACQRARETADLEVAVLRSLALLTQGDATKFCNNVNPPQEVTTWLDQAEIKPVRGLLIAALRRWHELQKQDEKSDKST